MVTGTGDCCVLWYWGEGNEMGITEETETISVLATRLRDLEKGKRLNSQHFQEIDKLREEVDSLKDEIDSLKLEHRFEIDALKDNNRLEINKLRQELIQLKVGQADLTVKKSHVSSDILEEIVADHTNQRKNMTSRFQRYLLNGVDTLVGFTAYIDHFVYHLGIDQALIFNRVLFNDGGAYNNASGIFTCPVNGVYLFFFEVGSGSQRQIVAKLVANNVNQVDAIADSEYHSNH